MELQSRIDFHQLAKPGNLANSAVLRMLEEEEKSGRPETGGGNDLYKDWIERYWDHSLFHPIKVIESASVRKWSVRPPKRLPWTPRESPTTVQVVLKKPEGLKRVAWPPPPEEPSAESENQLSAQTQLPQSVTPVRPGVPQSPQAARRFQSVQPPAQAQVLSQPQQQEPAFQPQVFQPIKFEPPRTVVQLRPSPPIRQAPSPVIVSQPATATVNGGQRMRGDQKWPPEPVKQQAEAENQARVALAKGPACRPRKVKKDYSSFFAQHALNSTYPGYRAPPGTQHYTEGEGTSNL